MVAVRVWLKIENSFLKRGKDSYLCEVEMQTKNLGVIFSKEKSKDCYESAKIAIHEVVQILNKKVEARMKRERKLRGLSKKAFA